MPMGFGHVIKAYFSIMPNNGLFMEAIKLKGRFHGKKKNDEISQCFIHNYIHWQVLETEDRRLDTGSILAADKFKLSSQFIICMSNNISRPIKYFICLLFNLLFHKLVNN